MTGIHGITGFTLCYYICIMLCGRQTSKAVAHGSDVAEMQDCLGYTVIFVRISDIVCMLL